MSHSESMYIGRHVRLMLGSYLQIKKERKLTEVRPPLQGYGQRHVKRTGAILLTCFVENRYQIELA